MTERARVELRFYGELNDFLLPAHRGVSLRVVCNGRVSAKHQIEAFGVPHTEVDLLIANGCSVAFDYLLRDGDRLAVYPRFHAIVLKGMESLRPPAPQPPRFLLDVHLGQLAAYLRLLGFDARYTRDADDALLACLAHEENLILVTRDRALLMRKLVVHGCCLRSRDPWEQLLRVLRRYELWDELSPWQRCLRCGGNLAPVAKEQILDRLEPKTRRYFDTYKTCQACGQIYWQGSHFVALAGFVDRVLALRPQS